MAWRYQRGSNPLPLILSPIIRDLNLAGVSLAGVSVSPFETDPPRIFDPDAALSRPTVVRRQAKSRQATKYL